MQRFLTLLALTVALGLSGESATALGLGGIGAPVVLGQPLNLTIGLRLEAGETLEARCVRADVTFGERLLPDTVVRTRLETSTGTGERRLRITTVLPVDEPVVGVNLRLGCTSGLTRSFSLLADPPLAEVLPSNTAAGDGNWVADRADTAVSPVLAAAQPDSRASAPSLAVLPKKRVSQRSRPSVTGKVVKRPVLRLDPVEAEELASPVLQMDTRLSPLPSAGASSVVGAYVDPEQAQRQQERERLRAMEGALLKLRADSQATQKSLLDMQARLRAAEAERYANPVVYLLVLLCVFLSAGLVAMWWLRRRDRAAAVWWTAQPQGEEVLAEPPAEQGSVRPAAEPEPLPLPPSAPPVNSSAPASQPLAAPAVRAAEPDAVVEPRRPMSAEELIDLEQQAEFFIVLGQDDAAIDLLMGHVRSTGGVSPLPYLKLLEIYRRRGEREAYDRIRERFNRRFNAYAPEWDVDPETGLSLEGYPEVMARLQDAWPTPSRAMELLDAALFRRDAGPTFDVPAYRELLFLYSTVRDLTEREVGPEGVDLLLPLGDEATSTMTSLPASSPSAAVVEELERFSLDLDVSTDQPPSLSYEDPNLKRSGH